MKPLERFLTCLLFAACIGGLIALFAWFPVSHRAVYESGYAMHQIGMDHRANLIGPAGEIIAEVWFDYERGRAVYKMPDGKFQDEMPKSWWRERRVK